MYNVIYNILSKLLIPKKDSHDKNVVGFGDKDP
jgi:hypothetical protein